MVPNRNLVCTEEIIGLLIQLSSFFFEINGRDYPNKKTKKNKQKKKKSKKQNKTKETQQQ